MKRQIVWLAIVSIGCLILGIFLKANLLHVILGLAIGGGVGSVLMFLSKKLLPVAGDDGEP
jgi:hypothetical protein